MSIRRMEVGSRGPLVERGYRDGGAFQWVRETVINAMEAQATRVWYGVEWQAVAAKKVYRRTIADNGTGMTPEELEAFFNQFGGGGKPIGNEHENYGIGAKTSLLPWNPYGVVVVSWKDGEPAMIWLQRDEASGEYGLRLFDVEHDDGSQTREGSCYPFDDAEHGVDWAKVKPDWITDHGTVIVLLGRHQDDDTFRGDPNREEEGTKLIAKYLNHRLWYVTQTNIDVLEFASSDKTKWPTAPGRASGFQMTRSVKGAWHYIKQGTGHVDTKGRTDSGSMVMRDGVTRLEWYLCHDRKEGGEWAPYYPGKGFIAALYRNELHNHADHHATYRNFGINETVVRNSLWLVIRPPESDGKRGVYHKADRNQLAWAGGKPLPLEDWGAEFAANMPQAIVNALRRARGDTALKGGESEWQKRIAEQVAPRFSIEVPRLAQKNQPEDKAAKRGSVKRAARRAKQKAATTRVSGKHNPPLDSHDGVLPAHLTKTKGSIPEGRPTRDPAELEAGMIASYSPESSLSPTGCVTVFVEHPVIREVVEYWQGRYPAHHAAEIREEVEDVYVLVARLKAAHCGHLSSVLDRRVIDEMRSPQALTTALLGLVAEDSLIDQRLRKFGKRKQQDKAA